MVRAGLIGRHKLIWTASAAAIATGIALATAGLAEASWTRTATLTANRWEGTAATVAVNRYGKTLLAWSAFNENTPNCYEQIQLRMRSSAGKLGPIETLTPCGPPAVWPVAAIDNRGRGVVAWIPNATAGVAARRVSPTGKLGPLRTLTPKGEEVSTVSVAMAPNGQAVAAWVGLPSGGNTVVQARYISPNGALGPMRTLGSAQFQTPSVVVGANGVATVAWSDGSFQRAVARRLTPAHVSRLRVIIRPAANSTYGLSAMADDSHGNTVFAVTRVAHIGNTQPTYLMVRKWRSGGAFGGARLVARNDETVQSDVALATSGRGNSIVAWTRYSSTAQSDVAFGRRVSRTGALGRVVRLGTGYAPVITIDAAGSGLVAWQSTPLPQPGGTGNGLTHIYARRFAAASGNFMRKFTLVSDGDFVRLGESGTGKIAAIWQQSTEPWPIRARFGP